MNKCLEMPLLDVAPTVRLGLGYYKISQKVYAYDFHINGKKSPDTKMFSHF